MAGVAVVAVVGNGVFRKLGDHADITRNDMLCECLNQRKSTTSGEFASRI